MRESNIFTSLVWAAAELHAKTRTTPRRNASFRGYADHMETDEFKKGLHELLEVAEGSRTGDHVRGSGGGDVIAVSSPII